MTRRPGRASRVVVATGFVVSVSLLAACGETIDLRDTADESSAATDDEAGDDTGSRPPAVDGGLDELLPSLLADWQGLDQRVIDNRATEPLARLETTWAVAEPLIRADHPSSLFGMQQAMDLARSAVERRRPADASKGYRLAIEVTDEILSR